LLASCPLFDHDDLATAIKSAAWADVVWTPHLTTILASNQVDRRNEIVSTTIALPVSADSLLGKRTHN
jgi:hypothetical protein